MPPDPHDFDAWVRLLADPARGRHAYWHLLLSGADAVPAIRRALESPNAEVRRSCATALDHRVDEDAWPQLIAVLGDDDARVRASDDPAGRAKSFAAFALAAVASVPWNRALSPRPAAPATFRWRERSAFLAERAPRARAPSGRLFPSTGRA